MNMHPRTRRLLRQHNLEDEVADFAKGGRRSERPRLTSLAMTAAVSIVLAIVVLVHLAAAGYALT
jgi:hypothetical protein